MSAIHTKGGICCVLSMAAEKSRNETKFSMSAIKTLTINIYISCTSRLKLEILATAHSLPSIFELRTICSLAGIVVKGLNIQWSSFLKRSNYTAFSFALWHAFPIVGGLHTRFSSAYLKQRGSIPSSGTCQMTGGFRILNPFMVLLVSVRCTKHAGEWMLLFITFSKR